MVVSYICFSLFLIVLGFLRFCLLSIFVPLDEEEEKEEARSVSSTGAEFEGFCGKDCLKTYF